MKSISRIELERSLKAGLLKPLYALVGSETYLRDQASKSITDVALAQTLLREFNESSFNLTRGEAREAIAIAEQLPMMSDKRVVRISEFSKLRATDEEVLINYLNRPVESSVVIFLANDLDRRKTLTGALLENCQVVEFPALSEGEARAWVKARMKELKVTAGEQVVDDIVNLVGTDVQTLYSEIDKLAVATADTGKITSDLVEDLIGRSRELSNFELGDHLLVGDRKKALETLYRLLQGGAQPVMLIGAIAGTYHRLAIAKELLTRGSREAVFRSIFMPSYARNRFIGTLQRTDRAKIAQGIQLIAMADLALKTSKATPKLQLELLVCELTVDSES